MTERLTIAQLRTELRQWKHSKYGNRPCWSNGVVWVPDVVWRSASEHGSIPDVGGWKRFASQRETKRYIDLRTLEQSGKIRDLQCQVRYPLAVKSVKICTYVADFRYTEDGRGVVIEDCKGHRTQLYKIKKALMKAIYGFEVYET